MKKNLAMKKNLQANGLFITGAGAGVNRGRGGQYSLQKYSKVINRQNPYTNKAGLRNGSSSVLRGVGAPNTDSELYSNGVHGIRARPGPTGIGLGSKNVGKPISSGPKPIEMEVHKNVESEKKATLDKLNNIQSKKFSNAY